MLSIHDLTKKLFLKRSVLHHVPLLTWCATHVADTFVLSLVSLATSKLTKCKWLHHGIKQIKYRKIGVFIFLKQRLNKRLYSLNKPEFIEVPLQSNDQWIDDEWRSFFPYCIRVKLCELNDQYEELTCFVNHQPRFTENGEISKILTDNWQSNEIFTDNRHVDLPIQTLSVSSDIQTPRSWC